ncbi:pantetheine-phosphate adenylyltransferase [Secundilactobacillus collinoides]|uniref:Phosphopantetheine adenylyltransferase n=2 Tax=Secundilactobacillus collinoides TaxID=33960 RepID=A0A0R2B3S2_SECCO|nr:pantetheine-phosphate adenylyltransferase [Secundilactobacillus collinoides]KRM74081.1 phosphopantetheine adenylyltransferase [Secundilactobacillus collinoides DSM 20515 = JCM 1123]KZL39039.1 phosphopantetheine adenylyltransferase [Secundilactobacillus collinoides]
MTKAVFPGSFDPLTKGHLNLIQRASHLFDELIVTVGTNISKRSLFTPDERVALIQKSVADLPNVTVRTEGGLTVDFVKSVNASVILRGLRNSKDYEYEAGIAQMNHYLDNGIETLFLLTDAKYAFISSSLLKEVLHFGGDISELVPPAVAAALAEK